MADQHKPKRHGLAAARQALYWSGSAPPASRIAGSIAAVTLPA
jgi:hypothetical protein